VWDLDARDQPWTASHPLIHRSFAFEELRPSLAAHELDATVVVQTLAVADETPELLALAAAEPMVAGVVGWADLTDPGVGDRLAELLAAPGGDRLVGIRHLVQDEEDPRWLCRPDVRRGLAAVGAAGLVYDLLVRPPQLPAAVETVSALPDVRFVLDHAGKPAIARGELSPWRGEIRALAAQPNTAVKLSGLITEADHAAWTVEQLKPYGATLLDAFGADRVMFGSDWPVCLLAASYDDVIAAAEVLISSCDAREQAAVLGGTATHWYRLEA
jgi:L-fuconolactonase